MDRLTEIDAQIAALEAEKRRLTAQRASPWPKRTKVIVHHDATLMQQQGAALGLQGEALQRWQFYGRHMRLEVEVYEDGTVQTLTVNGQPVVA